MSNESRVQVVAPLGHPGTGYGQHSSSRTGMGSELLRKERVAHKQRSVEAAALRRATVAVLHVHAGSLECD